MNIFNFKPIVIVTLISLVFVIIISLTSFVPVDHICNEFQSCQKVIHVNNSTVTNQVTYFLSSIFSTEGYPARWTCGDWSAFAGWTSIVSDSLIFMSYFGIPLAIFGYLREKGFNNILYKNLLLLFAFFILACGITHAIDVFLFWYPVYNLSISVKFVTAIISVLTLFALIQYAPAVMALKSPEQLELIVENQTLEIQKKSQNNILLYHDALHRTKNNLQLINSLIYMKQSDDGSLSKDAKAEIQDCIMNITVIDELVFSEKGEEYIVAEPFIAKLLSKKINHGNRNISYESEIDGSIKLPQNVIRSIGLISNEFITNSMKYAFREEKNPKIRIEMYVEEGVIMLLSDNGVGFDYQMGDKPTVGISLIEDIAQSIPATIKWNVLAQGTSLKLSFQS